MAFVAAYPVMTAIAALTAAEAISSGIQANQQAKYNARVSEMNAEAARRNAELEKYKTERRKKQMLSHQKALYAKAGVKFEGSPLEVLADTAAQYDLDKSIINYNSNVAYSRNMYEANFQRYAGKQRRTAGFIKGATTLLKGVNSINA